MKVTIAHADTCLPDYWSGHRLPHLQIPAYRMTFAELRRQLRDEIREGAVAGADDDTRLLSGNLVRPEEEKRADILTRKVYAAINRDIRPARKGDRLCFRDIAPRGDDYADVCAFFVILVED